MFHVFALAIATPAIDALSSGLTGGFVTNRTVLIGFGVALALAFTAKLFFRSHDVRQAERREDQQQATAADRNGPPSFNG